MTVSNALLKTCGVMAIGIGSFGLAEAAISGVSYLSASTREEKRRAVSHLANELLLFAASSSVAAFAGFALRFSGQSPFSRKAVSDVDHSQVLPGGGNPGEDDAQRLEDLRIRYQYLFKSWGTPSGGLVKDPEEALDLVVTARRFFETAIRGQDILEAVEAKLNLARLERDLAFALEKSGRPQEAKRYQDAADKRLWDVRHVIRFLLDNGLW